MRLILATAMSLTFAVSAYAQDAPKQILFTNCNVFDGVADGLADGRNILVKGNLIASIGDASLAAAGAEVIDCTGRTLMPGS